MTGAREEILARIRAAVGADGAAVAEGTGSAGETVAAGRAGSAAAAVDAAYAALPRPYLRSHHDPDETDIVALFAERAADYRAFVERVPAAELPGAVRGAVGTIRCANHGGIRLLVPGGLPGEWLSGLPDSVEVVRDEPLLPPDQLDLVSGVVTGCAAAIAETGTVILDHGPGQGRRALTLVPDFHLVIVKAGQIAADLPDALALLDQARPHTLVSGPSATSDIELIRVEGVHGPRVLYILIAD